MTTGTNDVIDAPPPSRAAIRDSLTRPVEDVAADLVAATGLSSARRAAISVQAAKLVTAVRGRGKTGMMESFLAEYGLTSREGIALMCLAEALLRVPDADTIDKLIEDKIAPSDWGRHLGRSASALVNASTWALMLTGRVLKRDDPGLAATLHALVRRSGEPFIRRAVAQAMKVLGTQFVLGETIQSAMARARKLEAQGFTHSYDMLGEAARTAADAGRYAAAYRAAIEAIGAAAIKDDVRANPGISVKLSALHPRFEEAQAGRVMDELVPVLQHLASLARTVGIGLTVDAEEIDRLELTLDVFEATLASPDLAGWDGFGLVVQAYARTGAGVVDWLDGLARHRDRRLMVRLVKGAYWDQEIKRAQTLGLDAFPVFTTKVATDASYIACAAKLLALTDRLYPQFATHNAHTAAAVLDLAGGRTEAFEFQRLHGMGEALHDAVRTEAGTRCRIYAPVGAHEDLLAYLVRRLLENGANSSFVHQIVDPAIAPETIAADPVDRLAVVGPRHPRIATGPDLFRPERGNAKGWDLADRETWTALEAERARFRTARWDAAPMLADPPSVERATREIVNPTDPGDIVGTVSEATLEDVDSALASAAAAEAVWAARGADVRGTILETAADLLEQAAPEIFALVCREAGKTVLDAVGEVREAADFLRYYAVRARTQPGTPRGVFACISPWNFPLAIFTGQITAALATGNAVVAKPAEQTPLTAARMIRIFHAAGVPAGVLQLLPGDGPTIGGPLVSDPRVDGVCFTGSTATAKLIDRAMAANLAPDAPLIAETGGLNAMIVDSCALPEQAVRDIVASAFQSAGQRCSALRVLYVQEDVAERTLTMLTGAMDQLQVGNPWHLATDVGPVIDAEAKAGIQRHIGTAAAEGRVLHRLRGPADGTFVGPTVIRVSGIDDLAEEVFGPVLHVATFKAADLDRVIDRINASGYGLTFGLHTRIDDRVQYLVDRVRAGNLYVNRNQIGAIVGSQPFGGEGLSGTGPKAGGPTYVSRFVRPATVDAPPAPAVQGGAVVEPSTVFAALNAMEVPAGTAVTEGLPGPTGELNRLTTHPRGPVLCLGPGVEVATAQAAEAAAHGCPALIVATGAGSAVAKTNGTQVIDGELDPDALGVLGGFAAVAVWHDRLVQQRARKALAGRPGPILPLIAGPGETTPYQLERHLCIDTTATGGNAALLALAAEEAKAPV